jgi:uncharacterized protein YbjT (DUF2867 family)
MDILVLGAGGGLGRLVCAELAARGHGVLTATRREARDAEALARIAIRAVAIIDCAGASVALGLGHGWRGYRAVDTQIGLVAAEAARRTGARLVYVGVHHPPALARTAYIDAHERVVAAMHDIDGVVVRATGFYSAFAALLPLARRGLLADIGDGSARTNPIAEHELAAIVAECAFGMGPREISAGGPQVLTRREIFDLVADVAGRPGVVRRLPVWLAAAGSAALSLVHPRMGQFARFAVGLARHDVIAPALGVMPLADYLDAARRDLRAKSSSAA